MVGGDGHAGMRPTRRPTRRADDDAIVIGIDIGTSKAKGVACTPDGTIVAEVVIEHTVSTPYAGWFEHDPDAVWWGETVAICRDLVAQVGTARHIRAVSVTTCGPCLVPVDADGRVLRPGILYGVDTRASDEIAMYESNIGRRAIAALCGMALTSQSVGPKIAWVARHEPDVARRTAVWHTATSFIVARLTGESVIDHHQASFFGPFIDARRRTWDLRYAANVDLQGRLPRLGWPTSIAGTVSGAAAATTGLSAGTPVLVGTSDGPTEALAVGASRSGVIAATYGSTTTLTTFASPAHHSAAVLWRSEGWSPDERCLAAGLSTSGAIVAWLRNVVAGAASDHVALADEATDSPPGARGLIVLPYFSGERTPFADPLARGVVVGLTLQHTRGDLHRAILEGIAYGIRHIIESFVGAGIPVDSIRASGGGTRHPLGPQIVSDVTGREQVVGRATIGASYGAAYLAVRSLGLLRPEAPDAWFQADRLISPAAASASTYDSGYALFRRLYRDTRPVVHALAAAADARHGGSASGAGAE